MDATFDIVNMNASAFVKANSECCRCCCMGCCNVGDEDCILLVYGSESAKVGAFRGKMEGQIQMDIILFWTEICRVLFPRLHDINSVRCWDHKLPFGNGRILCIYTNTTTFFTFTSHACLLYKALFMLTLRLWTEKCIWFHPCLCKAMHKRTLGNCNSKIAFYLFILYAGHLSFNFIMHFDYICLCCSSSCQDV